MRELIERIEMEALLGEASDCMKKYMDPKTGRFKGGKGERFDNCVKAFSACKPDIDDPEAMCASIARKKGLAYNQ